MSELKSVFVDQTEATEPEIDLWPSIVISKEDIAEEVERLVNQPAPNHGRRRSLIVHPHSKGAGPGLAPGIQVSLEVLKPGEQTAPIRHNSSQVNFCIGGKGEVFINQQHFDFELHDVWNMPSMSTYWYVNNSDQIQIRLCYSNAALLEKMNVHYIDSNPPPVETADAVVEEEEQDSSKINPFGTFQMEDGLYLKPYEQLISPEPVESKAYHWPWKKVKAELDKLHSLGQEYKGRRLYLLYNPATGRTNGTTMNFFATMCLRPANIVDRPHRHTAAAINYYFSGSGWSKVEGETHEWKTGDLMLSAPGWAIHNHASYDEPVYELTIQDSPLNIAMESLLWQEDLGKPMSVLGSETGFSTNRTTLEGKN